MSREFPHADGAENNTAPTSRSSPEIQGVDLSVHTNQTAATRMERAQL
jgi:hypothetical protein